MINVDGGYYYLDMDKINDWIFNNPADKKVIETGTVSGDGGKQVTKFEKEEKDLHAGIRYDIVNGMLTMLYNAGVESDEGAIKYNQELDDLSIGSKVVFNTLQAKGLMINKLEK